MNRRESLFAISVLLLPQLAQAQATPKLTIEYDANYSPTLIAFVASRAETVLNLTRQLLPLGVSPFYAQYGQNLVTALGWMNLGHKPCWNFFVNGAMPLRPVNYISVNAGDRIEWRPGKP